MQGNAAQDAASAQKSYAQQAQQLEQQNQQAGVNFQTGEWTGQQAAEQPYLQVGQTAANAYSNLLNNPFTAPTLAQAQNTPGYQFNLATGTQAINEQAAATGNLNSGNTGVALQKFGQGLATNTYQQAYQNALNQYQTNLGAAQGGINTGLNATGQLGQFGQAAANNLSNLYLTGGQQQASQLNNQGAAIAAGDIGQANAYANMFNGATNALTGGLAMSAIGTPGGLSGNYYPSYPGAISMYGSTAPYNPAYDPALESQGYIPNAPNPYATVQAPSPYNGVNLPAFSTANDLNSLNF